jgi:hypothetical protein
MKMTNGINPDARAMGTRQLPVMGVNKSVCRFLFKVGLQTEWPAIK